MLVSVNNKEDFMSRYDFARGAYGPAIIKILLADRTVSGAFGGEPALRAALEDRPFLERLEKGALVPADMDSFVGPLFAAFARKTDPSAESGSGPWKYLNWICGACCRAAREGSPVLAEDLSKIRADLADFEAFRTPDDEGRALPADRRDIGRYESYAALLEILRPFQQARDAKKAAQRKIDEKILAETTVVYQGPEGRIVVPHTKESCQFWGQQTRWCIAATKSENHFDRYNNVAPVYVYLPVPSFQERERLPHLSSFKFAGTQGTVYDENDQTIACRLPCLDRLIGAAAAHLQEMKPDPAVLLENVKKRLETLAAKAGRDGAVAVRHLKSVVGEIDCPPGTREHFEKFGSVSALVPAAPPGGGLWTDAAALKKAAAGNPYPYALLFADDSLRGDRALWLSLMDGGSPGHKLFFLVYGALPVFRNDPGFVREVMDKCGDGRPDNILCGTGDPARNDPSLVRTAIDRQSSPDFLGRLLRIAGPGMRDDPAVVTAAINRSSGLTAAGLFRMGGESVRNDPAVAAAAIGRCRGDGGEMTLILSAAGPRVRNDPGVVLAAIAGCGGDGWLPEILGSAGRDLCDDPAIVLAAVEKCESAGYMRGILRAAGDRVRADRDVVMKAYRRAAAADDRCARAVLDAAAPSIRDDPFFRTKVRLRWDSIFPAKPPAPGAG